MIYSNVFENASKARAELRDAIEWVGAAWEELSGDTVKNCWRHSQILECRLHVSGSGSGEPVLRDLAGLLLQMGDGLQPEDLIDDPSENWTAAPIDSDDEDAESRAALQECEESDKEEADEGEPVVPMTLREARRGGHALKLFVQQNQDTANMRRWLEPIEGLVREM